MSGVLIGVGSYLVNNGAGSWAAGLHVLGTLAAVTVAFIVAGER